MKNKLSKILIASLVLLLVGTVWLQRPINIAWAGINDDLVSYWKYNEGEDNTCTGGKDICDSQGSNHGERAGVGGTNNKPQWSDSQKPTLATANTYALDFDGVDDQVSGIGDIDFSGNAFSVSAWIYPDNWGISSEAYIHNILTDEQESGTDTTFCFRIGSQGSSALKQRVGLMIHDGTSPNDFESISDLSLDTWNHVAVTWDGSDVKFYINGNLDRTQSDPTLVMNNGTLGFNMGVSAIGTRYYDGGLDELRLYDRALTQTEVNELATVNPGVSTLSPVDGATGVGVNDNLVITFDTDMQAVGGNNIYIKKLSNDSVVETIEADDAKITITDSTVTINPTATLDEQTGYYVNIDSGAFEDLSNNDYSGMLGNESWNFTTEDATAPTVLSLLPINDSTGIATNTNLTITLSENVDAETGSIYLFDTDDTLVEEFDVTSDISGSGTDTITIDPAADLAEQTSYYIKIDTTAFDDGSDNSYDGIGDSVTWSFTTADETNPSVSSFSPLNNAAGVLLNSNLSVTFNEIVDVEIDNLVIYNSADDSVFETIDITSSQVTGTGTSVLTINPSDSFEAESIYYIQIDATAIDDISANSYTGISNTTTWKFTTIDAEADTGSVVADDDNTYSTDNEVDLDIDGTETLSDVTEMIISESPNFTGASWQDYATSTEFTLSDGDGVKAIYIKYRDVEGNESQVFVDYITVDTVMTLDIGTVGAQTFSEGDDMETTDTTPTLSGTAEPNSTITILIESDPITATIEVGADGIWTWTPDELLDLGEHTVTITGTDLAGNVIVTTFALGITAEAVDEEDATEDVDSEEEVTEEEDSLILADLLPISGTPTIFWGFVLELLLILSFFLSIRFAPSRK